MPTSSLKDVSPPLDGEVRTKAAHKKRKPIASQDTSTSAEDKKFNWNLHKDAESYLEERFQEMLLQDEREWLKIKNDAIENMLLKFTFDRNDGDMRKKGKTWFKNELQKHRAQSRNTAASSPAVPLEKLEVGTQPHVHQTIGSSVSLDELLAPLLKHVKGRASSAQNLWAAEHEDAVRERKAALGGGIGAHSTAVDQLFESLSVEERAVWEQKVVVEKLKLLDDISACFENQQSFPRVLALLIDRFIGFRPDQIGAAIVFFRIAMRNKEGGIDWDQYTVGVKEGTESFTVFQGGPQQHEITRWEAYGHAYLDENPILRDPRFKYEDDGCPKLPTYSDSWTMKDLAAALDGWLHAMWGYCREKEDLPNGLDWDVIKANPKMYIPSGWLDAEIRRPADVPFHILCSLYYRFFDSQDKPEHAFRWIHIRSTPVQAPITRAASINPVPATPTRQRRVVISTPATTPSRTRRDELPSTPSKSDLPKPVPCPLVEAPASAVQPPSKAAPLPPPIAELKQLAADANGVGSDTPSRTSAPSPPPISRAATAAASASACEPGSEQDSTALPHAQAAAGAEQTDADGDGIGVDAASEELVVASAASGTSCPLTATRQDAALQPVSSRSAEAADDIADNVSIISTLTQDSDSESGMIASEASAITLATTGKRKKAAATSSDNGDGHIRRIEPPSKRTKRANVSADSGGVTLRRSSRHNAEATTANSPSGSARSAPKAVQNKGRQNKATPAKKSQSEARVLRSRAPSKKGVTKNGSHK